MTEKTVVTSSSESTAAIFGTFDANARIIEKEFGVKISNSNNGSSEADSITVTGDEDLLIVTNKGIIIRTPISQISQTGRATQGVTLIRLTDEQFVSSVAIVDHEEEEHSQETTEVVENSEVSTVTTEEE